MYDSNGFRCAKTIPKPIIYVSGNHEHWGQGIPVVCSQKGQFAEVDHMEGEDMIKLEKDDAGKHHYIPLSWMISMVGQQSKNKSPR